MLESSGGGGNGNNGITAKVPSVNTVTVKPGDTLSSIAKANNTTVAKILAATPALTSNPKYDNGNMIWSGTKVNIPTVTTKTISPLPVTTSDSASSKVSSVVPDVNPSNSVDTTTTTTTVTFSGANLVASSTPPTPAPAPVPAPVVKTATPQYILPGIDVIEPEIMTDLIFENIGGQELLSLARHDLVGGEYVPQQLIANMNKINQTYDSKNLLGLSKTSNKYFSNFAIKLNAKIPIVGNGPDGSNVYLDSDGGIVIEFVHMLVSEQADIQIATNGTIYKVGN